MRLIKILVPVACLAGVFQGIGPAAPVESANRTPAGAAQAPRTMPGPMDVLYAAPGDMNYAYGPSKAARQSMHANVAPSANITVTYDSGFAGVPGSQAAFQAAVDIWAHTIATPATIRINAQFVPLGSGILGSAGPTRLCSDPAGGVANTYYAAALWDKLQGASCAGLSPAISFEINAQFSSTFSNWDFGTSGTPVAGKYNFMTVVMHEVGHGLGFYGSMTASGGTGSFRTPRPDIYDRFAVTGGSTPLISFTNPSTALGTQLVSNDTYFNGTNAKASNGAISPKLDTHFFTHPSASNGFLQGSSYSHIDDTLYTGTPNGLMTWALNQAEVYTDPGPIMRGMFLDEGWSLASTPSCTYSLAPTGVSASSGATTGTVALTTQAGCAWTAGSNAGFLSITSATSGTGSATVSYSIAANSTTSIRGGTLTIGGQTFTVTQAGSSCSYSAAPAGVSASFGAATGTVALTTQAGCAWTAGSNAGFLSITSATSGTGSATVSYGIAANPTTSIRGGTLTIGGQIFTVTQAGRPARHPSVDFNGDGIADIGVYRPEIGRWFVNGGATTDFGIAGDLPVPGDYNGDGTAEIAVFRPSNGTWYINGGATIVWGAPGDIPVPADYDGNGTTDIAVFRPSAGMFYVRNGVSVAWGAAGDLPVPGDYNGDGAAEIAVFRPSNGTWYINGGATVVWGAAADIPVPADYDGNGTTDIALFRPSIGGWAVKDIYTATWGAVSNGDIPVPLDRNGDGIAELGIFRRNTGTWYFKNHATDAIETVVFGRSGDIPLGRPMPPVQPKSGDFDGDRKADLTVFRPSTADWVSLRSASGMADYTLVNWGLSTDTPVAGDYDGDNKTDPAIYRPSTGAWYLRSSASGFTTYETYNLGLTGAPVPVPGDFDGDGRADVAVFRASTGSWSIRFSSNAAVITIDFGLAGDIPVVADYDGDGRADPAVFRPSTGRWYVLNRILGTYTVSDWGLTGDAPTAADFDGDGRADLAVFRPSIGRWFIRSSIDGAYTLADWGLAGDTLVPADFDGDGKADIAVFRPSTGMWYVRGLFNRSWGLAGDAAALKNP